MTSYPSNTAGIIQALIDLQGALGGGSGGTGLSVRLPMQAGEALNSCDAVYLAADGFVYKASNTATRPESDVLGFCREPATTGSSVTVIARGRVDGFTGLSTGAEYFLGAAGSITPTPPIGGGVYLTQVGQALSATSLDVQTETPLLLN